MSLLRKSSQRLQLPHQPLASKLRNDIDDSEYEIDDEVTFGRNRQAEKFGKLIHEDVELSDHVKFRLWLARQRAMRAYDKAHA